MKAIWQSKLWPNIWFVGQVPHLIDDFGNLFEYSYLKNAIILNTDNAQD